MARQRKRRKNVGPPPAVSPRRTAMVEAEAAGKAPSAKRRPGEPVPISTRGVIARAAIVAGIFYLYLVYGVGERVPAAILFTVIAFGLMVPLGLFIDRLRYNRQMRRWEEKRAARR